EAGLDRSAKNAETAPEIAEYVPHADITQPGSVTGAVDALRVIEKIDRHGRERAHRSIVPRIGDNLADPVEARDRLDQRAVDRADPLLDPGVRHGHMNRCTGTLDRDAA